MATIVFHDPHPVRVITHEMPGVPSVGIELRDGDKFGVHLTDVKNLDDLIVFLQDAREQLAEQYAQHTTTVPAAKVCYDDFVCEDGGFYAKRTIIDRGRVRIYDDDAYLTDTPRLDVGAAQPVRIVKQPFDYEEPDLEEAAQ